MLALSTKIAVIDPQGSISAANAEEFQAELIGNIVSDTNTILLVDMKRVEFLDSAGLMALVSIYRLAKGLGRRLSFYSVTPSVRMIFELTQLDGAFEIFEDRKAAETALSTEL